MLFLREHDFIMHVRSTFTEQSVKRNVGTLEKTKSISHLQNDGAKCNNFN